MKMYASWVEFADGYPKKILLSTLHNTTEDARNAFTRSADLRRNFGNAADAERWDAATQTIFSVEVPTLSELKSRKE